LDLLHPFDPVAQEILVDPSNHLCHSIHLSQAVPQDPLDQIPQGTQGTQVTRLFHLSRRLELSLLAGIHVPYQILIRRILEGMVEDMVEDKEQVDKDLSNVVHMEEGMEIRMEAGTDIVFGSDLSV
jgi:hypothetical protein